MDKFMERVALDARLTARVLDGVVDDLSECGLTAQAHLLAQLRDHYAKVHEDLSQQTPVSKGRTTLRGFPAMQGPPTKGDD
ncbi:MAG: hypothetical protein AAFP15_15990 [Bacteroidota bacterium]